MSSDGDIVTKSVTQERWNKTRDKIRWIAKQGGIIELFTPTEFEGVSTEVTSDEFGKIHFQTLESFVGFIVYVAQTHSSLVPYLKSIYLTMNSMEKRSGC